MSNDTDKQTAENGDDGRGEEGRFAPGGPGGPGRPAGGENKISATMRELVEQSVRERHPDGAMAWLNSLPDAIFVRLAAKLLPPSVTIEPGGGAIPIQVVMFGQHKAEQRALEEAPDDAGAQPPGLT
jgi:hypothetical protein